MLGLVPVGGMDVVEVLVGVPLEVSVDAGGFGVIDVTVVPLTGNTLSCFSSWSVFVDGGGFGPCSICLCIPVVIANLKIGAFRVEVRIQV